MSETKIIKSNDHFNTLVFLTLTRNSARMPCPDLCGLAISKLNSTQTMLWKMAFNT